MILGLMAAGIITPAAAEPPGWRVTARAAPEWNARFERTNGWIGADGAYSIPLGNGRTLWLYGDTFLGRVTHGRRTDAVMIHNSIALQNGTRAPAFHHRTDARGRPGAFFPSPAPGHHLWPLHGIRVGAKLWVFLVGITNVKTGDPFGFRVVDCRMVCVPNPDDDPDRWRAEHTRLPFTVPSTHDVLPFGAAVLPIGGDVHLFGTRKLPGVPHPELVVARVGSARIGDLRAWRFWNGTDWGEDCNRAAALFPGVATELSVTRLPGSGRWAAIYSDGITGRIVMRTAPAVTGPWSGPVQIYQVPEMTLPVKPFAYAAKAHPQLAGSGDELLVTYAVNSVDFGNLLRDTRLYWPRFVRVRATPAR